MADKPIEQYDDLDISRKVNNESGMQKLFRAGVLALGFSIVGKKMGTKNNDLLKYTGVTAASMLMSDDDDKAGDLMAVGAVFGLASGSKMLRSMAMENIDTYTKIYNRLEGFDKTVNNFNIAMMSLGNTTSKNFIKNIQKINSEAGKESVGKIQTAANYVKAGFNTIADGIKYTYENGISKSVEALADSDLKRKYLTNYKDFNFKKFETDINDFLKSTNIDIAHTKIGMIEKMATKAISLFPDAPNMQDMTIESALKEFKQMKKIQAIENNTFFTDMIGMYSKLDKESGKVVARYGQILKDDANILKPLEKLASNFERSLNPTEALKYSKANADTREKMFLTYLKDSGFNELIDKFYNKDDHIKIGEINELVKGVNIEEIDNSELSDFFQSATRNQMKNFDTFKYKNDSGKIQQRIDGIKHADILSNFSFTNVVTKTKFGVQDVTALDGQTMLLQSLGVIERNVLSNFKTPFHQENKLWNPLGIIDSKNRIKDVVSNDILGFDYNKQGFLLDGKHIKEEVVEETINGKNKKNIIYSTDGSTNNRISYKKTILDVINEDYKVAKENIRNESSMKDIINTYKTKGIKQALSELSYSAFNPLSIRYDVGNGVRGVMAKDGYFEDDRNIWNLLFGKKNTDDNFILNKTENHKRTNKFLNMFLGSNSDVNIDRMRAESNTYENIMTEINKGYMHMAISKLIDDPSAKNTDFMGELLNVMPHMYKQEMIDKYDFDERIYSTLQDIFFDTDINDDNTKRKFIDLFSTLHKEGNDELYKEVASTATKIINLNKNIEDIKINGFNDDNVNVILNGGLFEYYSNFNIKGKKDLEINKEIFKMIQTHKESPTYDELNLYYNMIADFKKANKDSATDISSTFINSTNKFLQNVQSFNSKNPVSSPTNPLNTVYELSRAKRYNDHYNKYFKNNEQLENNVINFTQKIKRPIYSMTDLGKTIEDFKNNLMDSVFSTTTDNKFTLNSYSFFSKTESEIRDRLKNANPEILSEIKYKYRGTNITDMSFKDMIKIRDMLFYENPGKVVSSVIVKDSLKKGSNIKEILSNLRKSIKELTSSSKSDKEYIDSTFNIGMKNIINGLQNSMEFLGIERLTNKELGNEFYQQAWNYSKYRLLPMIGLVSGAMAIDSASDAIVPDDVPIIGNGISGVAATGYATARIGAQYALKYTGALSVMRMAENAMPGLISGAPVLGMLDPLMDPEEMIDVYFKGKAIRVNDNRWWFTAGRQSAQGEEFGQYRPHFLYQMQHKSAGVYDNKVEKFFRKDFLLTKYPWYILDPYKEERDAYEKFGAVYPKTEQLFLDIPVIGRLLNATIGEIIKPTQYIGEEQWKVDDNTMLNPNYNPNDPSSPKYIHYEEPNKFVASFFEAVDDLATMSGLSGYLMQNTIKGLFGATNPYENEVTLKSIDDDTNYSKRFENLQLGGLYGTTEPIRRILNGDSLNTIDINPLRQNLPEWMPEFYKRGNNPYMSMSGGEYLLHGELFDDINENIENEDLLKLRTLSMLAPYSKEFDNAKERLMNTELSKEEQEHFYTSIGYANEYGKTEFVKNRAFGASNLKNIELTIEKKISYNEFISNGIRYKLDTVTDDFNKLSQKYGENTATNLLNRLNNQFKEGDTYSFQISEDAVISGGIDRDGDYLKITSKDIDKRLDLDRSAYNSATFSEMLGKINILHNQRMKNAMPLNFEKQYGKKTATSEWTTENVQSPSFRDWDNPISSFALPFYTYSANSTLSTLSFGRETENMYLSSNATTDILGGLVKLGVGRNLIKRISFGDAITSNEYDNETELQDELEKIKFASGDRSYYNMTGNENLKQFESMVNENDAKFLEELANTQSSSERNRILSHANERLSNVLQTIWNRQQQRLTGDTPYDVNIEQPTEVIDLGYYDGNEDKTRLMLQKSLNIGRSKLDDKRYGVISSYRGYTSNNEAKYIQGRMYQRYGVKAHIDSTIYSNGIINVNRRNKE